ncbi:MAG TPA: ATP-binding protein [Burkholderiaceae bacterium]|nr:ATP-binding protein [Burkholderiaceae bacterium]
MALNLIWRRGWVFPLAVLAAAAMLFVSEGSYWQAARSLDELATMTQARATILDLKQSQLDLETGQRGYLATGRDEDLLAYGEAVASIGTQFGKLEQEYRGNEQAAALIATLRTQVNARLAQVADAVQRKRTGQERPDPIPSAFDRAQAEAVTQLGNQLLAQGTRSVARSREAIDATLLLGRVGVMALTAIFLVALFLYLRHIAEADARQRELGRILQAERDQLEVVVAKRTEVLTELTGHMHATREEERSRLARNLHDELGALLTSAKLDAARIRSRLGDLPEARERLAHLVASLDASIVLGRNIIEDLRPSTLDNLGLAVALEILVREFGERSGVRTQCELAPVKLSASAELVLYRLVQEAITNISKYAAAKQVRLTMAARDGMVELSVEDDGVGFDPTLQPRSAYGLVGMRFRVEAERGRLNIVSAPGQGTRVQVTLPQAE